LIKRRWLRSVIRLLLVASLVATLGLAGVGAMHMGLVPPAYTPIPALDLSERGGLLTDWQLVDGKRPVNLTLLASLPS
jgi:hypothetical protein